jgi:membrane protein DedA with SNARE-associated domain
MLNLAVWKFLLVDSGGALVWAGAYIGGGWLFRRQLEDVAAAMSTFGAWFGIALGAGLLVYLISRFVRRRRLTASTDRVALRRANSNGGWKRASRW